jgi:hypothetical protein
VLNTEDEFDEAFVGFGEDKPAEKVEVPVEEPKVEEPKADDTKPVEEPKKDEEKPADDKKEDPAEVEVDKKAEEVVEPSKVAEPSPAETAQPLTKEDVTAIISNLRNEERTSGKELDTTTQEVLDAYYPEGLSNVLVDERSGKELRTPADVVDASGGEMTTEEAAQWLMNEQYKLDSSLSKIKDDARNIAETTVKFRRDAVTALEKYDPLFKKYPQLQQKVYDKLMKQVKVDEKKNVILSAPDVLEHYDDYLEPYRLAFEFSSKEPATAPVADPVAPVAPTASDRMDETGDGGITAPDDPNDFAQQVSKELSRGM